MQKQKLERHAAVYKLYGAFGKPIEQRALNTSGAIDLSGGVMILHAYDPANLHPNLSQQLWGLGKESPLVVRTTAESFISALTKNHTFIYSDWAMKVTRVFKDVSGNRVRMGDEITVTRTGGRLLWNGRVAYAHDTNFPDFVVGEDYVLYLFRVRDDPESYLATDRGSFRLDKTGVHYLIDPDDVTDALAGLVSPLSAADFLLKLQAKVQ